MSELLNNIYFNFALMIVAFLILVKSADLFVESAIGISNDFHIPRMIVGIIVVGFATTAPEIAVSVISALRGNSEFALGNAIGSVIVDDGVALAMAAIVAPTVIFIDKKIMKTTGIFLLSVAIITYVLAFNGIINRLEGMLLVVILLSYFTFIFVSEKKRHKIKTEEISKSKLEIEKPNIKKHAILFFIGLTGVIFASHLIVTSAEQIAIFFKVPNVIIGLTIIAIGTSLPEISTAIIAARKGEGELAVGNILGADILNLLWIIGISSIVNPINVISDKISVSLFSLKFHDIPSIHFSFSWMFIIVITMLVLMRLGYNLKRWKGYLLLSLYSIYFYMNFSMFG